LPARIIGVCDAYSAITSDRPYRDARTPAEAVAELRRCAGRQFDRHVVELLCNVLADEDEPATALAPVGT
jgi:HD-GYP domain-containing protein (c-di-GMP phosphodiesterase class II)